jgi:hypothetical protein
VNQHLSHRQVAVGTAATPLGEGMVSGSEFHLFTTATGNEIVYLGGPDVTTSTGFRMHKDEHITLRVPERIQLYAVASSAGGTVYVLQIGGI